MDLINNIYNDHTTVPSQKLNEILKHDIWWNADKCIENGLADEITKKL